MAEEGNHGSLAQGSVVAESAFRLAEHAGEDLMLEVGLGVGVFDDVDDVLGDGGDADYAVDSTFVVVEVRGPGVGGHHFGKCGEGVADRRFQEAKCEG